VEAEKERFRRLFPNLANEIEKGSGLSVNSFVNDDREPETRPDLFRGYAPTAIDYLRRAADAREAEATINSLESKNEISKDHAESLRKQLREKGIRSFGPRKEDDYYMKKGGY
jgi:hypothetical protein